MQKERSLRLVNANSTFFEKFTNKLKIMFIPTKVNFNYFLVSLKRSQFAKALINLNKLKERNSRHRVVDAEKLVSKLYDEYLLNIEKYVLDSMFKKVELQQATEFEKEAISTSYRIGLLKEKNRDEYRFKKQIFLLELDFDLQNNLKRKLDKNYKEIYAIKQTDNYRELFKTYSTELSKVDLLCTFLDIFKSLEKYTSTVIPINIELGKTNQYNGLEEDYEQFCTYKVGKLDEQDFMEKNLILISIGRKVFTHSIPHPIVSKCYLKLITDTKILLCKSNKKEKREKVYSMIKRLVLEYYNKILLSKLYWENEKEKEDFLNFWNTYIKVTSEKEKEIMLLKREIKASKTMNKYKNDIINFYVKRLNELGNRTFFGYSIIENKRFKRESSIFDKKLKNAAR